MHEQIFTCLRPFCFTDKIQGICGSWLVLPPPNGSFPPASFPIFSRGPVLVQASSLPFCPGTPCLLDLDPSSSSLSLSSAPFSHHTNIIW